VSKTAYRRGESAMGSADSAGAWAYGRALSCHTFAATVERWGSALVTSRTGG
jgi:hypothetical protein